MRWVIGFLLLASAAQAQDVERAAQALFDRMPLIQNVTEIAGRCGADEDVNANVAYCTSENRIYRARSAIDLPEAPYELAHQFAHAVFVQHGLADVALAAIRADRAREADLRGQVTRQIECIAGLIFRASGQPLTSLALWYEDEPFAGAHWGRNPLRIGPKVTIGLAERDRWFQKGQAAVDPVACEVPELPINLLIKAFRS